MKLWVFFSYDEKDIKAFTKQFKINCPFKKKDMNESELEYFRNMIINLYADYMEAEEFIIVKYDFEIKEEEQDKYNKYYR